MIKFACPNGHPLSAPENLAGKTGKCPKCSVPFVVPAPEPPEADLLPPGEGAESSAGPMTLPENPVAMGSGKGLANPADIFVFLCPNGHRLNGPLSLKGKAGQCPHCGAKFRVPSDEDLEEESGGEEEPASFVSSRDSSEGFSFPSFGQSDQSETEEPETAEAVEPELAPPPAGVQGLGYIVARLWDSRTDGSELEVLLSEGEIMLPEFYSEVLSSSDFGVFALAEGDGTYTISVVPWSHVRKVGMRKISELSPQVFR